uniref:C-type lectin domain-containing protein n=1 Tax=Sander lucioperca TaxID=283035 RepID=A0A8C9YWF8_SANLU
MISSVLCYGCCQCCQVSDFVTTFSDFLDPLTNAWIPQAAEIMAERQGEWEYFNGSFYYISSIEKTWQESRDDCLQKGADLVIINSKEEQDFTRKFEKIMWIGLTDSETEGTWKWVDGTPLTKSYWDSEEPNGGERENCGHTYLYNLENSWNDTPCDLSYSWICEMKVRKLSVICEPTIVL